MSGSTITLNTSNLYIMENNGIIESSLDNFTYTEISWPLTIERSQTNQSNIYVYIVNNLTINSVKQYFIVKTNNISFNGYYNMIYSTITINCTLYNGFIQNGSGIITESSILVNSQYNYNAIILTPSLVVNGYNNINITNINILLNDINKNDQYLNNYQGYICQSFFGYNATDNTLNNCSVFGTTSIYNTTKKWVGLISGVFSKFNTISNCSTNSYIAYYSGGILGSYSACNVMTNCYTKGNISEYSGGLIGCFLMSSINISNCFWNGNMKTNYSTGGGLIGCDVGYDTTNTINISNCYVTGSINTNGAIIGGSVYYNRFSGGGATHIPTNKPTIIINNCYSSGVTNRDNITNCFISPQLYLYLTSKTITNSYYVPPGNIWNDTNAKSALDNSANTWIYPSSSNNIPYILSAMQNNTPPFIYETIKPFYYVYVGNNITLSLNYMGSDPVSVNWYLNNALIPNSTTSSITITNAELKDEGIYKVILYNNTGNIEYNIYLNVINVGTTVIQYDYNVDISEKNNNIVYNIDRINDIVISSWPVLLISNTISSNMKKCIFNNTINITHKNQYFIFGCNNIGINVGVDVYAKINLNIPSTDKYNGFFQNGTITKKGYSNCEISKLSITGSATLNDYAGFLCQKYWGINISVDNINKIDSCSVSIDITGNYSGGLVGAYCTNCRIYNSYSTGKIIGNYSGGLMGAYYNGETSYSGVYSSGDIIGDYSGGIVGSYYKNIGNSYINNCFSSGNILGLSCGGIFGSDFGYNSTERLSCNSIYTLGKISESSGGIFGGQTIKKTNLYEISIMNCYVNGEYNNNNSLIAPNMLNSIYLYKYNVYISNNKWSNIEANNILNDGGWSKYINNIPYILSYFGTQYSQSVPIYITSISPTQYCVVNSLLTISVFAQGNDPITYQWQYSSDNITFINTSYINYQIQVNASMSNTGYYRCIVSNNVNSITSSSVNVIILSETNPIVTNINPIGGGVKGGSIITVTGTNFNSSSNVYFGTILAETPVIVNSTTLTVISPSNIAGIVSVTVQNKNTGETSPITDSCNFTYLNLPDSPKNIVATSGNGTANISWTPSDSSQNVLYYTINCSDSSIQSIQTSNNNIIFIGLHNDTSYTFTVSSTNNIGTGNASEPSNSITPRNTPIIATLNNSNNLNYSLIGESTISITIKGNYYYLPQVSIKSEDGLKVLEVSNMVLVDINTITCNIQNTESGIYNITISDIGGVSTLLNGYIFYDPPTITNITPNLCSTIGATNITIYGTNFLNITGITFDNRDISIYNNTSTNITFKALPKLTSNNPNIIISLFGISISTNLLNYISPPTLTSSDASTQNTLIIIGTNFDNAIVNIDTIPISTVNVTSTQITITNYTYSATAKIQISTQGGSIEFVNGSSSSTYNYVSTTISSIETS